MSICFNFGSAACGIAFQKARFFLSLGWRACFLLSKITSERVLWTLLAMGNLSQKDVIGPEVFDFFFRRCFRGICY